MLLRDTLRAATRTEHDLLEADLGVLRTDIARSDYIAYLRGWLGYYRSVAGDFDRARALWSGAADCRIRIAWLEDDLAFFGVDVAAPAARFSNPCESVASAAGASYVIEGSALGGQVLYRALHARWGLAPRNGASFLWAFGAGCGAQWRQFVQALNALTLGEAEVAACVAAARQTFRTLQSRFAHERRRASGAERFASIRAG